MYLKYSDTASLKLDDISIYYHLRTHPKNGNAKRSKWMLDLCPGDFQVVWDDLMTPNGWICKCKLHQPWKPISTWIFHTSWDRLSVRLPEVNDTRGWKNPREREVWLWLYDPSKMKTHEKVILVQNHWQPQPPSLLIWFRQPFGSAPRVSTSPRVTPTQWTHWVVDRTWQRNLLRESPLPCFAIHSFKNPHIWIANLASNGWNTS